MKAKPKASRSTRGEGALSLTAAEHSDVAVWRAMRQDLYSGVDEAFNEFEISLILAAKDRECLLVRDPNEEPVGFVEVSLRNVVDGCLGGPVGYIEGIYLIPSWRGLGLGPAMIEAVAEWFRAQGCRDMATDAEMENEDAQQFWSDLGFEETWRIVQYRRSLGVPEPESKPAGKRGRGALKKSARKRTSSRPRRR